MVKVPIQNMDCYFIIDLDTGTVVSNQVVAINVKDIPDNFEEFNDSDWIEFGATHGKKVYI